MDKLIHMVDGVMGNAPTPLPPERRAGSFQMMSEALRAALALLEEDQECYDRTFLPDPTPPEESLMKRTAEAITQIKAALAAAEERR